MANASVRINGLSLNLHRTAGKAAKSDLKPIFCPSQGWVSAQL